MPSKTLITRELKLIIPFYVHTDKKMSLRERNKAAMSFSETKPTAAHKFEGWVGIGLMLCSLKLVVT